MQIAVARPAAAEVRVTALRLGLHPDHTRIVADLTGVSPYRVSLLADPWRVRIEGPTVAAGVTTLPATGLVTGAETGGDGRRLDVRLGGPARLLRVDLLPGADGRFPRLVVDVASADAATARAATGRSFGVWKPSGAAPVQVAAVPVPAVPGAAPPAPRLKPPAPGTPQPVRVAVPVPRPKPPLPPMIVLDPGHGGQDPGATAVTGQYEKTLTLDAAKELRRQLLATGRYRVAMTRETDVFLALRERVAVARARKADLFLSLHADSLGRKEVRGMSVYTLSDKASDREAEMLAQRENRADAIAGVDLGREADEVVGILIDLAQRDTRNRSRQLANLIVAEAGRTVRLLHSPVRSAGFAVLTAPDVPAVLVEMGYLSHPGDAKLLASADHRRSLASSLVRAIDAFFAQHPSPRTVVSRS